MEMMTRRSFLKITGAMALAVGAAGALSGCDAVDNAVGSFFQQYGDQKGHAADSAGSFMYALSNQYQPWSYGEELVLLAVEFQVKNLTNETVTFKASDITSATIDGHKAKVVLDPKKAANVSGLDKYTPLFDANGTKTYGPGKDLNKAEAGYICFQPVGEAHVNKNWSSLEFTFNLKGKTSTFVMNRNADGSVTSARK
ncbi:MAG: hypothetical protein ACLU19_03200 [Faecalibacterium sp.]